MIDDVCALIAEAEAKGLQGAVLTLDQLRAVLARLRAAEAERDEARSRFNDLDLCRHGQAPCKTLLAAEAERDRMREAVNLFVPEPTWWGWSSEGGFYPDDQMTSLRITFGQARRARKLVEGGE
jgi:hypothetical protein